MKLKRRVKIASLGLTLLCSVIFYHWLKVGLFDFNFYLTTLFLISSIGLVFAQEWARKVILTLASFTVIYFFYLFAISILRRHYFDLELFFLIFILLGTIKLFLQPFCIKIFRDGDDPPSWRILFIDDDKTFLKLMKSRFLKQGISILTAETGEKGLERATKYKPDLIVLDVIMPGLKGHDVCAKLKEDSRTKEIPIIFLTVTNTPEDIRTEMEVGGILHMTKPVDFETLYSEIQKVLGT